MGEPALTDEEMPPSPIPGQGPNATQRVVYWRRGAFKAVLRTRMRMCVVRAADEDKD